MTTTTTDAAPSSKRRKKSAPSSSSSCAAITTLPDDLLAEVFLRVPIKSILRLQATRRSWSAILSSEEFCRLYAAARRTEETPSNPKLLFVSPAADFTPAAVYACSPSDSDPTTDGDLVLTLDDVRGNSVEVTPAPCHGLTLLYDGVAAGYHVFEFQRGNAGRHAAAAALPLPRCGFCDCWSRV